MAFKLKRSSTEKETTTPEEENKSEEGTPESRVPLLQHEEGEPPDSVTEASTPVMTRGSMSAVKNLIVRALQQIWGWSSSGTLLAILCYTYLNGGILLLIAIIVMCLGLFYNAQDYLLYYPDQPDSSRLFVPPPTAVGLHPSLCENLFIKTSDRVTINALLVKQAPNVVALVPTIIFFHGNAGNIGHRLINAAVFHSVCHCNVLLVEYRGYGKSEGEPSEEGFYQDAQAALDYLHTRSDINSNFIFVFGRSLGGAIAIDLASRPVNRSSIRGLLVENTFTSIPEMGRRLFRIELIKWAPICIVKNKYFSINKIPRVKVPTLFLSGGADELVPPEMMQVLFERCGAPKKIAVFENGTHNETWQLPGYCDTVREFLARHANLPVFQQRPEHTKPVPPNPGGGIMEASNGESSTSSSSYEMVNL